MTDSERNLAAKVSILEKKLSWAESSIDALVRAVELLNQGVNPGTSSRRNPTFDSMHIKRELDSTKSRPAF